MGTGSPEHGSDAGPALSREDAARDGEGGESVTKKRTQASSEGGMATGAGAAAAALYTPTDPLALLDGSAYVRAVALKVDLVAASARLLASPDDKTVKGELDRLRELIFGKAAATQPVAPVDEGLRIDWEGFPRPKRGMQSTEATGGERDDS
ncbi:MAG TPA: hypothetical protein VMT51_16255 [Dongiaceae bacterium]|nr:hypothetical protein [Dongiaceae bacterium]